MGTQFDFLLRYDPDDGGCCPGGGLSCPDDPLDLVLNFLPPTAAADVSLAALGIGGTSPPRWWRRQDNGGAGIEVLGAGSAPAPGGVGGGGWDSCASSTRAPQQAPEEPVDMFFADDAPDGAEETPRDKFFAGAGAVPVPIAAGGVYAPGAGALGGVVPSGAPPRPPPPTPAAGALRPYACRAFDGGFFSDAPPPVPACALQLHACSAPPLQLQPPVPAGFFSDAPPTMPAGGLQLHARSTPPSQLQPPVPAGFFSDAPPPMPAGGLQLHARSAPPLQLQPPMSAGALRVYACRALDGGFPNDAPPMPAGGLYECGAGASPLSARSPLSAMPSPASRTSSGSGCPPQTTSSETELPAPVSQPQPPPSSVVLVPRRLRSPPLTCRKRPWWLAFPLHALPPVAPPSDPPAGDSNGSDDDAKNSCDDNAGGDDGIRCRHRVARRRNRQAERVCSHCGSPETPQWRAGPEGPGTLCNACGLRYKSGKLYPEYRPSTAPGFQSGLYSNRHKKVKAIREENERNGTLVEMGIMVPKQEPMKSDEFKDVHM